MTKDAWQYIDNANGPITPEPGPTAREWQDGWQPMETAPRDGTPILMFLAVPSKQAVGAGSAPVTQMVCGDLTGPGNLITSLVGDVVRVTHWMPLPPPPKTPL